MSTPTSSMMDGGVSPPPMSTPIPSASTASLYSNARVINPSTTSNVIGDFSGVVTGIPSAPYTYSPCMQNAESCLSGSTSFVQGFPWNGGHIPLSAAYVGPLPTYVGVPTGNQKTFFR